MITTVTTNPTRVDRAVITIHQFRLHVSIQVRYILSFFSKEKEFAYLILRAHTYHFSSFSLLAHYYILAVSSARFTLPQHRQFFSVCFLFFLTIDYYAQGCYVGNTPPDMKIFSFYVGSERLDQKPQPLVMILIREFLSHNMNRRKFKNVQK